MSIAKESPTTRVFGFDDQRWFSVASGDWNPMHVDPVAARRTLYGRPVVHGVHVALWALDVVCSHRTLSLASVQVTFAKPVYLGDPVSIELAAHDAEGTRVNVTVEGSTVTSLKIRHEDGGRRQLGPESPGLTSSVPTEPLDLQIADLADRRGAVAAPGDPATWASTFGSLSDRIGASTVAELAALSTLVGMSCPGLHSVFGSFDVRFDPIDDSAAAPLVEFTVTKADARYSIVRMNVTGRRLDGQVTAFVRPRPTQQRSMRELSERVAPGEFAALKALVVGGSRGLGEATAKLVAAGGGEAIVTFHHGRADADSVVKDIRDGAGLASAINLDVSCAEIGVADIDDVESITHVFYFASPRITDRRLSDFDRRAFDAFVDVYVDGFIAVIDALVRSGSLDIVAFYPSSVFVDDGRAETIEYAMAKASGEVAARFFASSRSGLRVHVERLPPVATDQTASFLALELADPAEVMLDIVRAIARVDPTEQD